MLITSVSMGAGQVVVLIRIVAFIENVGIARAIIILEIPHSPLRNCKGSGSCFGDHFLDRTDHDCSHHVICPLVSQGRLLFCNIDMLNLLDLLAAFVSRRGVLCYRCSLICVHDVGVTIIVKGCR